MMCGVISSSIFRSSALFGSALEVDLLALRLAQPGDLALLEVRLGEDLAVHLHQDLLDDLGSR